MSRDITATARATITSVRWERVQLLLDGHVQGESREERGTGEWAFYLENRYSCHRIPVSGAQVDGSGLSIHMDMMQIDDGLPLTTGTWSLFMGDMNDEPEPILPEMREPGEECTPDRVGTPVAMGEGLSINPASYGGLFAGRGTRYWVFPVTTDNTERSLALSVNYRSRRAAAGRTRGQALKAWSRQWVRKVREALYVATYRTARALVSRNGHRILFTSDSRVEISGNLLHVHRRMLERGLGKTYQLRTIFKPSITAKRSLIDKIRFPIYLGISDVVLMDDYQPMIYKVSFPDDVKVIQLWHASGAFKTVGYSRVGKPGGPAPFFRDHRIYTHAIVSSQHDVPFYSEAFGIAQEKVVPTGIPRMDMFFDDDAKAKARSRALEAVPAAQGKRVILFAPTFRGNGPSDAYYDYDLVDLSALYEVAEAQDALVIIKMHPFIEEHIEIPQELADRIIDATELREVNDLLMIADLVITDYSSLVFEYSALGGPMLFFAYDLEEYEAERDFYEPLIEFAPGKIVATFPELLEALRTGDYEQHKVAEFAAEHFDHHDSGSSDRVIDDLILG